MGSNPACPTKPSSIPPADRIAALDRALRASDSATATLEHWCGAAVTVRHLPGDDALPDPATRSLLGAGTLRLRRVHLRIGTLVVSVAENWYAPARLPPGMDATLQGTDIPFGRVVAPLGCSRTTLEAVTLPPGTPFVLEHRAVLARPDGLAVCVVRERYTRALVETL